MYASLSFCDPLLSDKFDLTEKERDGKGGDDIEFLGLVAMFIVSIAVVAVIFNASDEGVSSLLLIILFGKFSLITAS